MKRFLLTTFALALGFTTAPLSSFAADDYFIFKVSATLPLNYIILGSSVDRLVTKALTSNDLVNLSLGRPLGTPVDKDKAMLVVGFTFAGPLDADQRPTVPPLVKFMIYDRTAAGAARKVQDLATISLLDYQEAFVAGGHKGQGICAGKLLKTPAVVPPPGDPSQNQINDDADFHGAATVRQADSSTFNAVDNFSLTATSVSMRLKITLTDKNGVTAPIDGYVLKGTFKTTGKRIDTFSE